MRGRGGGTISSIRGDKTFNAEGRPSAGSGQAGRPFGRTALRQAQDRQAAHLGGPQGAAEKTFFNWAY